MHVASPNATNVWMPARWQLLRIAKAPGGAQGGTRRSHPARPVEPHAAALMVPRPRLVSCSSVEHALAKSALRRSSSTKSLLLQNARSARAPA